MVKKKVLSVVGTRPEIIKMSPVIPQLDKHFKHIFVHTGQHYSFKMDKIFFRQLKLRNPDYNLAVGSADAGHQTAEMIIGIEKLIKKHKPDFVLVQGDTNSALAAAIAASKSNLQLGHVEAGCRCFNKARPEEVNRLVIDHSSDIFFAPDKDCFNNLVNEGIPKSAITLTGNTLFEAVSRNYKFAAKSKILQTLNLAKNNYVVFTSHRAEHTDKSAALKGIISAINKLSEKIPIVFPIHPRSLKMLKKYKLKLSKNIIVTEPLGYLDFLCLLQNCIFIMTDSGGIQEEAIILNTPCLIISNYTEWIDFVRKGKNILVGTRPNKIIKTAFSLLKNPAKVAKIRKKKYNYKKNATSKIISKLRSFVKRM